VKLCLAFLMENEAPWIRLHFSPLVDLFDGVVALDGGSTDDSVAVAQSLDAFIFHRPFEWDFAAQGNALIRHCEDLGFDAMLRLDPDETLWPRDVQIIKKALRIGEWIFGFRRYNFVRDRLHYATHWYPDIQQRAWRLNQGVRYVNAIHEVPVGLPSGRFDAHIYHYGWIKDVDTLGRKSARYAQLAGQDIEYGGGGEYPPHVPFEGKQPLDPAVIGRRAPYGDV
jgi:glycosyl transferase family 2